MGLRDRQSFLYEYLSFHRRFIRIIVLAEYAGHDPSPNQMRRLACNRCQLLTAEPEEFKPFFKAAAYLTKPVQAFQGATNCRIVSPHDGRLPGAAHILK